MSTMEFEVAIHSHPLAVTNAAPMDVETSAPPAQMAISTSSCASSKQDIVDPPEGYERPTTKTVRILKDSRKKAVQVFARSIIAVPLLIK